MPQEVTYVTRMAAEGLVVRVVRDEDHVHISTNTGLVQLTIGQWFAIRKVIDEELGPTIFARDARKLLPAEIPETGTAADAGSYDGR